MVRFSEAMDRLGADLRRSRDDRAADRHHSNGEVERFLAETRTTLTRAAADRFAAAKKLAAELRGSAHQRAHEVRSFLCSERKALLQRAEASHRALQAALSGCRREVEEIRTGGARLVEGARAKRYEEGNAAKDRLVQFVTDLRSEIGGALGALERGRCDFASDLLRGARSFRANLAHATAPPKTGKAPGRARRSDPAPGRTAMAEPVSPASVTVSAPTAPGEDLGPDLGLTELDLPERIHAALCDAGVRTLEQLTARTHEELLAIPGIGQAAARDVERFLRRRGHRLKG